MNYLTREEADSSFDEKWQGKGVNTMQTFEDIKSFLNTTRQNDLTAIREIVGELPENYIESEQWRYGNEIRGMYDERLRLLQALQELENKLK